MTRFLLTALGACLVLVGCSGSEEDTGNPVSRATTTAQVTTESTTTTTSATTSAPTSTDPGGGDDEIESAYTTIDFDDCEVVESFPESGGSVRRCEGYDDTALYVSEGDGRFDLDAGARDDVFLTGGRAFNTIGDTVEWRLRGGEPFAVIARFDFDNGFEVHSSELAVVKVGTPDAPGCLIDWVPPDALPDQNTAARRIADERAADFACALGPESPELPPALIGRFAPDADECAEIVSVRDVIVTPERLDFFYGYADIRSISPVDDGFRIEATLYLLEGVIEVVPEPATYTITPAADGIVFDAVGTPTAPELLIRCDHETTG